MSETGATWGGSLGPAQSEQHNSVNCSSEELVWETDPNASARIHIPSAFRLPQNVKSPASKATSKLFANLQLTFF